MKRFAKIAALLAVAAVLAGTTGCFKVLKLFSVATGNLSAVNGPTSAGKYIVLADESSDYADNKDKLKTIDEYGLLGTIKNNLAAPVTAEVWIVENPAGSALLGDKTAVQNAGGKKLLTMNLAANETKQITWGNSWFALFTPANDPVVDELLGDATFTIYVFGSTATYDIDVTNAVFYVSAYIGNLF